MVTLLLTEQLTVLFLMMGCGFVLVKTKIVKSRDSKTLSLISVYLIVSYLRNPWKIFKFNFRRKSIFDLF